MLLKNDFKNISLIILKKFCKKAKIKSSKLNKLELFEQFNKYLAVILIQRKYRNHLYKNAVDPITLEEIEYPCFLFRTKYGKTFFYSYESIIRYIMKTGNTSDPMTRLPYSNEILERLDNDAKKHLPNFKFKSTLKIKNNPDYARRIRNRENEIISYQTRIAEVISGILISIDLDMITWTITNILIDNNEYNNSINYINSILYEFRILVRNLNLYEPGSGTNYITELTRNIERIQNNKTKEQILLKLQIT
jgi:hypothetical protein